MLLIDGRRERRDVQVFFFSEVGKGVVGTDGVVWFFLRGLLDGGRLMVIKWSEGGFNLDLNFIAYE